MPILEKSLLYLKVSHCWIVQTRNITKNSTIRLDWQKVLKFYSLPFTNSLGRVPYGMFVMLMFSSLQFSLLPLKNIPTYHYKRQPPVNDNFCTCESIRVYKLALISATCCPYLSPFSLWDVLFLFWFSVKGHCYFPIFSKVYYINSCHSGEKSHPGTDVSLDLMFSSRREEKRFMILP